MLVIKESPSLRNRFYILDLTRFLAALAVVFYHYSIYFSETLFEDVVFIANYGYLGVPFFFMLSGFVITASAQNRTAFQFALSRISRLYPAFWACLLFTCAVVVYCKDVDIGITQLMGNATILNDYFGVRNVDDVYWTLQAEIKFYGCIFLLLALNLFKYVKTWLAIWLILAISHHFFDQPYHMGWLINPAYSFYFIGGICSYLLYQNKQNFTVLCMFLISLVFSVVKAGEQVENFYSTSGPFGPYIAASIVALFYLFFILLSFDFLRLEYKKIYVILGAISYPLYLCHNRAGKALIEFVAGTTSMEVAIAMVLIFVLGFSYFVYFVVERNLSKPILVFGNFLIQKIPVFTSQRKTDFK